MRFIPNFRGFDFFPHHLRLPFMRYKGLCFGLSLLAMALSLAVIWTKGFNYGVDFTGGTAIEVQSTSGPADLAALRSKISGLGIGNTQIQSFGNDTDVLIRIEQQKGDETAQKAAVDKVTAALGDQYQQRRFETVGPAVSSELRRVGFQAVLAGLVAIVAYVWLRFEWQFAIGAIVALTHDVLVVAGIFSVLQLQFDLSIVAALLTILGYSVNDTVVLSDRIRENLRKYKKMEIDELLDVSINEILPRTVLTSFTTLMVLFSLYLFGGEVIRNFNLAMLLGVIVGTYSSMFIGAPLLAYLGVKRDWSTPNPAGPGTAAERRARTA